MAGKKYKVWDKLSTDEKVTMMKIALRNGVSNMDEIKRQWNEFALGGKMNKPKANYFGRGGDKENWRKSHQQKWFNFLKGKGLQDTDAKRISGFFTAQDGLESAGGTSAAAREKNNFGGMQRGGRNIAYPSVEAYMEDKWKMMKGKFGNALAASSIDEYAEMLGHPDNAGKSYLYYVTDKAKYDPKSPQWRAAQTDHMHNYINGMRVYAGMPQRKFAKEETPMTTAQKVLSSPTLQLSPNSAIPAFMPRNPEAFFAPLSTYTKPVVVKQPAQPIVDMAAQQAALQKEEERERRNNGLALLMGILGDSRNNGYFDVLGDLLRI